MDNYGGSAQTNASQQEKQSNGLLASAEENARRAALMADRLTNLTERLCRAKPREVQATNDIGRDCPPSTIGAGLGNRLGGINTAAARAFDECERALNTLESFV